MKIFKKNKNYILAFLIPFIICMIIFLLEGVFENIENIYVSDLRSQHLSFYIYLKNILLGKASIFYSFSAGMGSPMLATVIFYCLSPINLLLLAIKDVQYAILFIYITKISLSGLTMFLLLKYKSKQTNFMTIIFSTCYALSSFAVNYFFSIFWFDTLYLAPLVIIGIEKIITEQRINLLYIFSLALAIICNIQMGFSLCIFSLMYYIYTYKEKYTIKTNFKKFKELGIIFSVSSLCAAAISGGAIWGFLDYYSKIKIARDLIPYHNLASNIGLIIKNILTVGRNTTLGYLNIDEPYVYCGLIITFFSILYFFNEKINIKKRKKSLIIIFIFIISFCTKFINEVWHISSPILLDYRYSIYLSLFLTIIAYENYRTKKELTKKEIIVLISTVIISFLIVIIYKDEVYIAWTITFALINGILILLTKNISNKFEPFLITLIILEIIINGCLSIHATDDISLEQSIKFKDFKNILKLEKTFHDYRVMYNYSYTDFANDTLMLNNNSSLRYFSSVINGNLISFFVKNQPDVGINNYNLSAYESPLLLSLLGNKYFYLTEEFNNSLYKKKSIHKLVSNTIYFYENPYSLTLGYVIENDTTYKKNMDPIDYQNKIIQSFTGTDKNVLIRLNYKNTFEDIICDKSQYAECKAYEITNNTKNNLIYIYTIFDEYEYTKYNNIESYLDAEAPLLLNTKVNKINITIKNLAIYENQHFTIFTYDEKQLIKNLKKLQENMLRKIKFNKNKMTGEINSSKDGILFLSIPYEEKFKIYIDNKEVKYYPVLDNTFIGLDLKKGEHKIKLEYIDENYKYYILASIISIILTLILYYLFNKNSKKIER